MRVYKTNVKVCPLCFMTPTKLKIKVIERDDGNQKYAGQYYSCDCGAYTESMDRKRNLLPIAASLLVDGKKHKQKITVHKRSNKQ